MMRWVGLSPAFRAACCPCCCPLLPFLLGFRCFASLLLLVALLDHSCMNCAMFVVFRYQQLTRASPCCVLLQMRAAVRMVTVRMGRANVAIHES
jgi:hypothetical protein